MNWSSFCTLRESLRAQALAAESASQVQVLLRSWDLSLAPDLVQRLCLCLETAPPNPHPGAWAALMADLSELTPPDDPEADHSLQGWVRVVERQNIDFTLTPRTARAFGLMALALDALQRRELEQAGWAAKRWPVSPDLDLQTGRLWVAWMEGSMGQLWSEWPRQFAAEARRVLRVVLTHNSVPEYRIKEASRRLTEDFLLLCVGEQGTSPPWLDIAVRIVECAERRGPITGLCALLGPDQWDKAWICARTRVPWVRALSSLTWDEAGRMVCLGALPEEPIRLTAALDLSVTVAISQSMRYPSRSLIDRRWATMRHQLDRARGRLRALAQDTSRLRSQLLSLDALHARTVAAVRQYFYAWAWELARRGELLANPVVTPSCMLGKASSPPRTPSQPRLAWSPDVHKQLSTWLVLVALRRRWEALERWVTAGGKTSGGLERLFELLPDPLLDRPRPVGGRIALRHALQQRLPALRAEVYAVLSGLRSIPRPSGRSLQQPFVLEILRIMPQELTPQRGFPSMWRAAQEFSLPESGYASPQ